MLESIFSQVVATIIAAALLGVLRIAFEKYKRKNDYTKATISYVFSNIIILLLVLFGLICTHQIIVKILIFLVVSIFFTINVILFARVMRLLSRLEQFVQHTSAEGTDSGNKKNVQP